MTEKITVEKLRGSDNYASWSNDLSIILNHYERWSWIEGEHEHPPTELIEIEDPVGGGSTKATNPEYSAWKKGANEAMFRIVMTAQRLHPIPSPLLDMECLTQRLFLRHRILFSFRSGRTHRPYGTTFFL